MKLVVIIPTYNERKNIIKLFEKLEDVFQNIRGWKEEFLVVDDNSPDATWEAVQEEARKNKKIRLLLREKKSGLGAAYLAGMRQAFDRMGANVVLVMDADLSHDPTCIPSFLKKVEEGADFVVGSRYVQGGSIASGWTPHRKFLSVFGNLITRLLLGKNNIHDWTSGYRAIKKEIYKKVYPKITDFKGYTFNISFAYYAVSNGAKIAEVPIQFIDRTSGESKLGFEYLFHTPIFLLKTRLLILLDAILGKLR